jgi:hypothetical protein
MEVSTINGLTAVEPVIIPSQNPNQTNQIEESKQNNNE